MTEHDLCRCGHEREAHEHYRAGSDCSLCPGECMRFEAATTDGHGSLLQQARRTLATVGGRRA